MFSSGWLLAPKRRAPRERQFEFDCRFYKHWAPPELRSCKLLDVDLTICYPTTRSKPQ